MQHQYIDRQTSTVRTEKLFGDRIINALFSQAREDGNLLIRLLTSARFSALLGFLNYDAYISTRLSGHERFLYDLGVNLTECIEPVYRLNTPRRIFERQIRYWQKRPMTTDESAVVSPADSKILLGSFSQASGMFIKDKLFVYEDLLGRDKPAWTDAFAGGDFAVFRLTPEKYHYNHFPVSGTVVDIYELAGGYYPCNPGAAVEVVTPYSKNKRVVTIIDTDVDGGTRVGLVAMIEVAAMMIGGIEQRYSPERYEEPQNVVPGLFVKKGQPKSLYRPGSSTDVTIFQQGRVSFCEDLVRNQRRTDAVSRYSLGFDAMLVETDIGVRSTIGYAIRPDQHNCGVIS